MSGGLGAAAPRDGKGKGGGGEKSPATRVRNVLDYTAGRRSENGPVPAPAPART
ncbi:hypothetical protein QFZ24_007028 [Streptomyces phaeochromogenes]|jgi:hypothetical protein|nr:hypothetical protein [Streptomyces phaeochromogenes]